MKKICLFLLLFVVLVSSQAFGYSTIKIPEPLDKSWGKLVSVDVEHNLTDSPRVGLWIYHVTFENAESYVIASYLSYYADGETYLDRVLVLPKPKETQKLLE